MTVYTYEIYFKDLNRTKIVHTRSCESISDAVQLLVNLETYGLHDEYEKPYFYDYNCEFVLRQLSRDYSIYNFICSYYKDSNDSKILLCNNRNTYDEIKENKKTLIKESKINLKCKD